MKLSSIASPQCYAGLYAFDFGAWTAFGYTAAEVALLLESEEYREGKVYKIVRVAPDGQMELRGISGARFQLESGMFFNRAESGAARSDFEELQRLAGRNPPPCRAYVQLVDRGAGGETSRFVTALIYPAEYEDEVSRWLLEAGYAGGDTVEGGSSHVSNYQADSKTILERVQLWSQDAIPSRSRDEVYRDVRRALQR
jgi:hypothetical protein